MPALRAKAPITGVWGLRSEPARRSTAGRAGIGAPNPGSRTPSLPVGRPGAAEGAEVLVVDASDHVQGDLIEGPRVPRFRRAGRVQLCGPGLARGSSRLGRPTRTRTAAAEPSRRGRSACRPGAPSATAGAWTQRRSTHGEPQRLPPATGYGTQGDRQRRQPPSLDATTTGWSVGRGGAYESVYGRRVRPRGDTDRARDRRPHPPSCLQDGRNTGGTDSAYNGISGEKISGRGPTYYGLANGKITGDDPITTPDLMRTLGPLLAPPNA